MSFGTIFGLLLLGFILVYPIAASCQEGTTGIDTLKDIRALEDRASAFDARVDSATSQLNVTIDSLKNKDLPVSEYAACLDSAYRSFRANILIVVSGIKTMDEGQKKKLAYIDSLITAKTTSLDSLRRRITMTGIGATDKWNKKFNPKLPEALKFQHPTITSSVPKLPGKLMELNRQPVSNIPELPQTFNIDANVEISKAEGIPALPSISEGAEVVAYGDDNELLTKEGEMSVVERRIESRIRNVDEVKAIKEAEDQVDLVKEKQQEIQKTVPDNEALRGRAKKEFVNHLVGREDIVKKDMEDIGKVQLKYRNVADSRFLPQRIPNAMKGRPTTERLIPGFSLQIFNGNDFSVDFAPFVGYRFSGRISAGVSLYQRISYIREDDIVKAMDFYGFRLYNNVRILNGISTHLEVERYKGGDLVRSKMLRRRQYRWDTKINFGLHQRYNVGKRIYGHFLIIYDMMQIRQFPNTSGSSIRFGFDYQLKQRKQKEKG